MTTDRRDSVKLAFVVARGSNGVIGAGGDLPWRLKSDLKRFKRITMGKPIVMGRKTWESLPRKPLPGRANIVVSRALEAARAAAIQAGVDEVCVIGGAQLYDLLLEKADRLYLTEVDLAPEGDAHFPDLDESLWIETSAERVEPGEGDDAAFTLRVLDRRR